MCVTPSRTKSAMARDISRSYSALVPDVEQEARRHRRRGSLAAEELELAIPALSGQRRPTLRDLRALLFVCIEHFLHRRRQRRRRPFRLGVLERFDDHLLLAHDLPGNLLGRARLLVRTVVRTLRNPRENLAGGLGFLRPELGEHRFLVHGISYLQLNAKYSSAALL